MTKDYADYYLLQDGDEIFFTGTNNSNDISQIPKLIEEGYTFGYTSLYTPTSTSTCTSTYTHNYTHT